MNIHFTGVFSSSNIYTQVAAICSYLSVCVYFAFDLCVLICFSIVGVAVVIIVILFLLYPRHWFVFAFYLPMPMMCHHFLGHIWCVLFSLYLRFDMKESFLIIINNNHNNNDKIETWNVRNELNKIDLRII